MVRERLLVVADPDFGRSRYGCAPCMIPKASSSNSDCDCDVLRLRLEADERLREFVDRFFVEDGFLVLDLGDFEDIYQGGRDCPIVTYFLILALQFP